MTTASNRSSTEYVTHPLIQDETLESREYQTELVEAGLEESSIIALPTGTGKTPVALRMAARRLDDPGGRVVFLAPTQPLVDQQADFARDVLTIPDEEILTFTGGTDPDTRAVKWSTAQMVVATPQCVENDLIGGRYTLDDACHLIVDECHNATGNNGFSEVASRFLGNAKAPLVTGLSASPGRDREEILDRCSNLGITNVEVLTEDDPTLEEYLPETTIDTRTVTPPEAVRNARDHVETGLSRVTERLRSEFDVLEPGDVPPSRSAYDAAERECQVLIEEDKSKGYEAASLLALARKLTYFLDVVDRIPPAASLLFVERIRSRAESDEASEADQRFIESPFVNDAIGCLRDAPDDLLKLRDLEIEVAKTVNQGGQVLVFASSRSAVAAIRDHLNDAGELSATAFVGQDDKYELEGMSQQQQQACVDAFREGDYDVLVATSVAEEGIDIPTVDLVIFFDPVSQAIRLVQRRGRTGRQRPGRAVHLVAKGTNDEHLLRRARRNEREFRRALSILKNERDWITRRLRQERSQLAEQGARRATQDDPVVIGSSGLVQNDLGKTLAETDALQFTTGELPPGMVRVSKRTVLYRLRVNDLVDNLREDGVIGGPQSDVSSDGSLYRWFIDHHQRVYEAAERPIFVIEGAASPAAMESAVADSEESSNAIESVRRLLGTLQIRDDLRVILTEDSSETVEYIISLATAEATVDDLGLESSQEASTEADAEQISLLKAVPGIGDQLATDLLREFGTTTAVLNATEDELTSVAGIGPRTAGNICSIGQEPHSGYED